jgi:hypothetical protein
MLKSLRPFTMRGCGKEFDVCRFLYSSRQSVQRVEFVLSCGQNTAPRDPLSCGNSKKPGQRAVNERDGVPNKAGEGHTKR